MPEYKRVRNGLTGHEYDKPVSAPLNAHEAEIPYPRTRGRWCPPKFRVDLAGRPTSPRKSPSAIAEGTEAAAPADNEKE